MYEFGAGTLWGFPVGGNTAANPTPKKFGVLQDVSLDISGDVKQLYGQRQFPEAVARGKCKISGKAKFASINGKQMNDLFFGQPMGTGTIKMALDEVKSVTAGSATVSNSAQFVQDFGVVYAASGLPLTRITGVPAVGQYSVSAGVYTFNTGDNGSNNVQISYTYTSVATGSQINVKNQLMGFAPTIQVMLSELYNDTNAAPNQFSVLLYSVVASKLNFATKQEDFLIPEFDFEAFANAAGQVIDIYSSE
jgi:hypothetical protein